MLEKDASAHIDVSALARKPDVHDYGWKVRFVQKQDVFCLG